MLAAILATALAANGTPDWPQRINLEPGLGVLASSESAGASTPKATPRDPLIVPRIAVELLGGALIGGAMFFVGALVGGLSACGGWFCSSSVATSYSFLGAVIGEGLGALSGVELAGTLLRGKGSFLWTLAGELAGIALAVLTSGGPSVGLGLVLLPVLGAVVGFEVSGALNAAALADQRDAQGVAPLLAPVVARF